MIDDRVKKAFIDGFNEGANKSLDGLICIFSQDRPDEEEPSQHDIDAIGIIKEYKRLQNDVSNNVCSIESSEKEIYKLLDEVRLK